MCKIMKSNKLWSVVMVLFYVFGSVFAVTSCSSDDAGGDSGSGTGNTPTAVQAIDLGLPSGLKWANMNVGATSVTSYGDYFAWGETKTKKKFIWETYLLCNGSSTTMTKYCTKSTYGEVDHKEVLEPSDDAAHVNWGGNWRMPTDDEFDELIANCYIVCTMNYNNSGVAGSIIYKVKSNSDKGIVVSCDETPSSSYSVTDTHIFMPAAGRYEDNGFSSGGTYGFYWTSSLYVWKSYGAWRQPFGTDGVARMKFQSRCYGFSVRAVCE